MDDAETRNRRLRLAELIDTCFGGFQADLMRFIAIRTKKEPNQGELSALIKLNNSAKSFGDKKAKTLTEQIGLHRRWFDFPLGTNLDRSDWLKEPSHPHPTSNLKTADCETETLSPPLSMAHAGIFPVDDLPLITEEDIMGKTELPDRFLFRCPTELPSLEGGLAASDGDILLINCKVRAELGDIVLVQMKVLTVARVLYAASGGIGYFVDCHIIEARDAKLIGVAEEVRKLRRSR